MKIRVHKAKNKQKRNKFSIIKRTQTTKKEGDTWQRTQKKLKKIDKNLLIALVTNISYKL